MPDATGTPTSPDSIPTYATSADPPSGKGFNTAMAAIQAALTASYSRKPAGIVSGEVPVWNGSAWVRSSVTPLTAGIGASSLNLNIGSANTDLAAPSSTTNFWYVGTGGGTLRSIGVGVTPGAIISLRNDQTAITLKHQLAGGSGARLFLISVADTLLNPGNTISFMYDGTNWSEIAREVTNEFSYNEFQSGVVINATTEGTANAVATSSSITYDGATPVLVEFFAPDFDCSGTANIQLKLGLFDNGTALGTIFLYQSAVAISLNCGSITLKRRLTPSAASHAYSIRGYVSSGAYTVQAGGGGAGTLLPGFIRVSRAT